MARENATPKLRQQWTKFVVAVDLMLGMGQNSYPNQCRKERSLTGRLSFFYFDENMQFDGTLQIDKISI